MKGNCFYNTMQTFSTYKLQQSLRTQQHSSCKALMCCFAVLMRAICLANGALVVFLMFCWMLDWSLAVLIGVFPGLFFVTLQVLGQICDVIAICLRCLWIWFHTADCKSFGRTGGGFICSSSLSMGFHVCDTFVLFPKSFFTASYSLCLSHTSMSCPVFLSRFVTWTNAHVIY